MLTHNDQHSNKHELADQKRRSREKIDNRNKPTSDPQIGVIRCEFLMPVINIFKVI
jgi:hypothetical protein